MLLSLLPGDHRVSHLVVRKQVLLCCVVGQHVAWCMQAGFCLCCRSALSFRRFLDPEPSTWKGMVLLSSRDGLLPSMKNWGLWLTSNNRKQQVVYKQLNPIRLTVCNRKSLSLLQNLLEYHLLTSIRAVNPLMVRQYTVTACKCVGSVWPSCSPPPSPTHSMSICDCMPVMSVCDPLPSVTRRAPSTWRCWTWAPLQLEWMPLCELPSGWGSPRATRCLPWTTDLRGCTKERWGCDTKHRVAGMKVPATHLQLPLKKMLICTVCLSCQYN